MITRLVSACHLTSIHTLPLPVSMAPLQAALSWQVLHVVPPEAAVLVLDDAASRPVWSPILSSIMTTMARGAPRDDMETLVRGGTCYHPSKMTGNICGSWVTCPFPSFLHLHMGNSRQACHSCTEP